MRRSHSARHSKEARRGALDLSLSLLFSGRLWGGVWATTIVGEGGIVWIGCSAGKFRPGGGEQGCTGAGLAGPFSLTRPLLVDHWLSEIKEPQHAAGRGGPQQNSPQRHGTIGSMHRQSVALRESKLGVVWSCLGASRSGVSGANLSFAGGPFAKSVVCCDCHRTLSVLVCILTALWDNL
jgi:hypothetical protein